jgi:sortase (surface protein transpeptidase)
MSHAHSAPQSFWTLLPVSAVVMNGMLSERLVDSPLNGFVIQSKRLLSHGLTILLITISCFGFYEIATLFSPAHQAASTRTPVATASASPAIKPVAALSHSVPTSVSIPTIGVNANVTSVGQNSDGSIEVPGPYDVGWYNLGPSPGEIGPAVLVGHVDYVTTGPAVFWHLRDMQPGDTIQIAREDGKTVNFTVEKVQSYGQEAFPTQDVYGNLNYPGLRLITCTGDFNYVTHHYSDNLVVYARAQL